MSESTFYECCGNLGTHTAECVRRAVRESRETRKFTDAPCPTCGTTRRVVNHVWLRERRKTAKMMLREFARQAGVSAAYICDIEHGRRNCLPDMRERYERLRADTGKDGGR